MPPPGARGNSPTETSYTLTAPYQPDPITHWVGYVGSLQSRIGVELDPAGPTWLKHFSTGEPGTPLIPVLNLRLSEYLVIAEGPSWTGWTMQTDAPNYEWELGTFPFLTNIRANGAVLSGLSITPDGDSLRFTFDPLPPGTRIDITAYLRYTGGDVFNPIDVRQLPTPEPTTLLSFILLSCLTRRR